LVPFLDRKDGGEQLRQGMAYAYYANEHDSRRQYIDSALHYLEPGVRTIRNDAQGHFRLAEALMKAGRASEAGSSLTMAIDLQPRNDKSLYELARVLLMSGESDSAIALYREALRIKPAEPAYLEALGIALAGRGEWKEAETILEEALRIDSRNYLTHLHLGNIAAIHRNDPGKALDHYHSAIILEPDAPELRTNIGNMYFLRNEYDRALAEYTIQTERWPATVEAWVNMARVYAVKGERQKARAALQRALSLSPGLEPAIDLLAQIEMGSPPGN
jgi:tetratricopeptide (TPR) repeat protein